MIFQYNQYQRTEPCKMYISWPGQRMLRPLTGIVSAKLTAHLNDIWEIDFEIDSVLDGKANPIYGKLYQYMEIKVDTLGWFRIDETPTEYYSDGRQYKTFTAVGYESSLQDLDLNLFSINCATPESIEMYEENVNELGIPKHNIQLYIPNASEDATSDKYWKLGLLNILEHEYLYKKGWTIGTIDIAVASKRGRQFEVNSQNIYAFLTQDAATAYRCMFQFDRKNLTINAYAVENIGKSLNLELSLRNVINSITITDQNDVIYNSFRTVGADDDQVMLEYINFGSDRIYNYNYFIETGMIPAETAEKYKAYAEFKESKRQEYSDLSLRSLEIDEEISAIENQVPIDELNVEYDNLTLEELKTELETAQNVVKLLEEMYTVDGVLKIEGTSDYAMYISMKEGIIPKIEAEIASRESGTPEEDEVDWETNWELYGINELEAKKTGYERSAQALADKGYDKPWSSSSGVSEEFHNKQYELYKQYQGYITAIDTRLNILYGKVDLLKQEQEQISEQRKALSDSVQMDNEQWGFTEAELKLFDVLTYETDFQDSTIEILDTDHLSDVIDHAWDLLDSANEELEIESRPQLSFSIDLDNLYHIAQFQQKAAGIELGDFIYLELMNGYKTKQRLIKVETELVNFNDTDLVFEFSDAVTVYGKADDYRFLLESNGNSSRKNSISKSSSNDAYISGIASTVAAQVLKNYFSGTGGSVFPNGISDSDLQKLIDALSGLVDGNLTLDQLEVELAKIDHLDANSAFVKYLQSQFLVANQGDFQELTAKVAIINDLLAGNVSAEVGQLIHLTAENVQIDEAVIKDLIAAQILVSDLKAGDITLTDTMRILSENGLMVMNGETLQIMGTDEAGEQFVAIQLGYDTENKPSLIIRDSTGSIMLDASGLHESGVPDGLIKDNMIAGNTISKDKLNFEIIEPNEFGGIDITQIYDGKGGQWGVQYNQFRESTETALSQLNSSIKSIELSGEQVFKEDNGEVSPATITISAITKGNITVGKWYLDDVENTSFVSSTGTSITIPYTYMQDKTTLAVKVEDTTGQYYDVMSIYKVSNGANGEDGITVVISSSEGYVFTPDTEIAATQFTATVYKGLSIIEPISYEWKAITDDGSEWVTIGTSKQVIVTMNSFVVRKRVKCIVNVEDPVSEPIEGDTIGALTDVEITEIITLVFGSDAVPLKDTTGSDILDTTEAQILTSIDPETIAI